MAGESHLCLQMLRASRVEGIAQAVAQQVDAQDDEDDEKTGEDPHPPGAADQEGLRLLHHIAPRGSRLLNAEAQEGNISLRENGACQTQCGGNDDGSKCVRYQVTEENTRVSCAQGFGCGNIIQL